MRTIGSNPFLTRRILLWSPETQIGVTQRKKSKRREDMLHSQLQRERQRISMSHDVFLEGAPRDVLKHLGTNRHRAPFFQSRF